MKTDMRRLCRSSSSGIFLALIMATGAAQAATYVVDTTSDDAGLSSCSAAANDCSLRGAIADANTAGGSSTISFDGGIFASPRTIALDSDLPAVTTMLAIGGPGRDLLVIDGQDSHRPFRVASGGDLTLAHMTVTRGAGDDGAGIRNAAGAVLTLIDCALTNNTASQAGGSIFNAGTLAVSACVFSGNIANDNIGGAIYVHAGSAVVTGSLFVDNSASFSGGGIANEGTLLVVNSTFSGNVGGDLRENNGHGATLINTTTTDGVVAVVDTITLRNSILTGAPGSVCDAPSGGSVDAQNTLIRFGSCGATGGVNGNLTGDPMLGGLSSNGGGIATFALLPGSPAIDAADDAICNDPDTVGGVDQRGVARPQGAHCDMGAYERLEGEIFGDGFEASP